MILPSFKGVDVEQVLNSMVNRYGKPRLLRSENASQFIATHVHMLVERNGTALVCIEPGKPRQNGSA